MTNELQTNDTYTNKLSLSNIIIDNKSILYPIICYFCGLLIGSFVYNKTDNKLLEGIIKSIIEGNSGGLLHSFSNNIIITFSIFFVCLILGLCIIGFSVVNIVPLICGLEIAIKLSYFYVNYGPKGIGYALLIIIPGTVMFMTVLVYTIELSNILSHYIYNLATRKIGMIEEFNLKSYLLRFLIYSILIGISSLISSLINYLLSSLIIL